MDILTHVASGALCGAAAALGVRGAAAPVFVSLLWGGLGGFLPDLDAASRIPGYDALAAPLGWPSGTALYFGSRWCSHHHFAHSLAAGAGVAAVLAVLLALERLLRGWRQAGSCWPLLTAPMSLFAGFLAHLAGDLVTPASVWGGIQLLWPAPNMVGGWGWTWWFNNYDLLLAQLAGILALLITSLAPSSRPILARALPLAALLSTLTASVALLRMRQGDYAYEGHALDYNALEQASLDEQRRLLPPALFEQLRALDEALPFNL
jgi:hypothetical protein